MNLPLKGLGEQEWKCVLTFGALISIAFLMWLERWTRR